MIYFNESFYSTTEEVEPTFATNTDVNVCIWCAAEVKRNLALLRLVLRMIIYCADEGEIRQTTAACGGRSVPAELLDSGDLECSLCMR